MRYPLRSILAATDIDNGSDAIVSSAAGLAARTGADLHLIHAVDLPWRASAQDKVGSAKSEAEDRLQDQVDRTMPKGVQPASREVVISAPHKAILDRAEEVYADLIVVGPHRGGAAGAHFLGTTADRVIRTSAVPCLVLQDPLTEEIQRVGVPIDFSDASDVALEAALSWGLALGGRSANGSDASPEIRVMHVGWTVEQIDDPDREERVLVPELKERVERARSKISGAESLNVSVEVLWGNSPVEETLRWVKKSSIDLLVMGTQGRTGLKRALLGSMASRLARQTPCPVLLVPPSFRRGQTDEPVIERVMIATDFHGSVLEAARWSVRNLAPDGEYMLVHALDIPKPPAVLAGRYGSREELLRSAHEGVQKRLDELRAILESEPTGNARVPVSTVVRVGEPGQEIVQSAEDAGVDLILLSRTGRSKREQGAWAMLGGTVERVLRASSIPVLVASRLPEGPPRNLLVAVDGSQASLRALRWADFLRSRSGGSVTAIYVESPVIFEYADLIPTDLHPAAAKTADDWNVAPKADWQRAREDWLTEQIRRAGVDPDTISTKVAIGRPADEILAEQERGAADLIVMGTHGSGTLVRALLGTVAGEVLDRSACSVLVLGDPGRVNGRAP